MTIKKIDEKTKRTLVLDGRLDTTTTPQLEEELKNLTGVSALVMDFEKVEYISSAGLRAVLSAHKLMSAKEGLVIKNLCPTVKEVFDITGFTSIINIK